MTKPSQAASEERARIVAWLRERTDRLDGCLEQSEYADGRDAAVRDFDELIDAIERGEHVDLPRMKTGPVDEAP